MKVYVVTMYRWGDRERHSYVLGVFAERERAVEVGVCESLNRGRKYFPEVLKVELNKTDEQTFKVITELKKHLFFDEDSR